MIQFLGRSRNALSVVALMLVHSFAVFAADTDTPPKIRDSIARGQEFLRRAVRTETNLGRIALATMALVKSGEPKDSALIKALTARLTASTKGGVFIHEDRQFDNYVAAVVLMALRTIDQNLYFDEIDTIAQHLISKQNPNGSWDYPQSVNGDTSQSQYACLALWEALVAGSFVGEEVWDKALHWFIITQDNGGGFTYHPTPPKDGKPGSQGGTTHSMSTAGAGSMVLCRSQLPKLVVRKKFLKHDLLIPVIENQTEYEPIVTPEMAEKAVDKADRWMASNIKINVERGAHQFYYLYGVERYASLSELKRIGATNWYPEGADFIADKQAADGSWTDTYQTIVETSFAILFLGRSTEQTLKHIQVVKIGRGTMLGGRGIPTEGGGAMAARKKERYRKMDKSPIEDLLSLIETPEAKVDTRNTAAALETMDSETIIRKVGNNPAKLRALARNENPQVRQAALTALSRTMDFTVVPVLIAALEDPDPDIYRAARDGLRWISRRFDGFSMPQQPPPPAELAEGVKKWREWFATIQVEVSARQEFDE